MSNVLLLWHICLASVIGAFAMNIALADNRAPATKGAAYIRLHGHAENTKPVELWQRKKVAASQNGGHAIYDSKTRAEIIGLVWNVTPQNMNSFKQWGF